MGQYYKPCIIVVKNGIAEVVAWISCYAYGNGAKQMEHSYLGNNFVGAFEWLISPEGPYHKGQVVWAGDYGAQENGYGKNADGHVTNLYGLCNKSTQLNPEESGCFYRFVVNHTKKCYLDKRAVKGEIHPLPLLTTETDSGGGGDYRGANEHFLGIWARDEISVENEAPEGYEKVSFEFEEDE